MFTELIDELMALDDTEITERFRTLELRRRHDEAELAGIIAVADTRRVWAGDGHLSVKGWLRANANWSIAETACQRKTARTLNDYPVVGDALLDGHIGVDQAHEIGRARSNRRCGDHIGQVIEQLVHDSEQLSYEGFRKVVKRWETMADADGAHRAAEITNERRTALVHAVDTGIDLRATGGSALKTAAMLKIFDRFLEAEFDADVAVRTEMHGPNAPSPLLPRTDAQRRFDALVKIFETASAAPSDVRFPEPILNLVVTQERFEYELLRYGLIDAIQGPYADPFADLLHAYCETDNEVAALGADIIRAALAGHVRRVVINGIGTVIDFGRKTRLFTGAAREAIKLMNPLCDHLGCDIGSTTCQIDHIAEWVRHRGRTDSENGRPKCGGHNRNKHRLGLTERIDRYGTVVQFRRDGTPILPVGRRLRLQPRSNDSPGDDDSDLGSRPATVCLSWTA